MPLRLFLLSLLAGAVLVSAVCGRDWSSPVEEHQPMPVGARAHSVPAIPAPPSAPTPASPPGPSAAAVQIRVAGESSWALRDLNTGAVMNGGALRNTTESMIKAWIAVDYVARRNSVVSAADDALIGRMIRFSDDQAAQSLYLRLGSDASVNRMITTCGLRDTSVYPTWWSKTTMPASDAALLGACVARGPGMSPEWRDKLLGLMRTLGSGNAFGIPEAPVFVGKTMAVKNGWTLHGTTWAVNCLGIWDHWVLAVMVRYPERGDGHRYGASVCSTVAQQLFGSI